MKISNFDSFNEGSMKDISSDKYELVWGDGPGRGTFIIIDQNDDSSLRNTGADALEDYNIMKKLLAKGEDKFNAYVADNYTFSKDESNSNTATTEEKAIQWLEVYLITHKPNVHNNKQAEYHAKEIIEGLKYAKLLKD